MNSIYIKEHISLSSEHIITPLQHKHESGIKLKMSNVPTVAIIVKYYTWFIVHYRMIPHILYIHITCNEIFVCAMTTHIILCDFINVNVSHFIILIFQGTRNSSLRIQAHGIADYFQIHVLLSVNSSGNR